MSKPNNSNIISEYFSDVVIVDIETTSLDRNTCGLVDVGAVHFATGNKFYVQCNAIGVTDFDEATTLIHGVTKSEFYSRDPSKYVNQKVAVELLIDFCFRMHSKPLLAGWNLGGFDALVLCRVLTGKLDLNWALGHRSIDIHSAAWTKLRKSFSSRGLPAELGVEAEKDGCHTGLSGVLLEYEMLKKLI